ncbi:hypothetical protein [Croceicoccus sp. YJ47]|uniref:hypothetical protein n=1 Tax=Croceicoccus sp. YJ47 TaxID=2798724 RepID=UPI001920A702|nr:hypothetical protein [Croceicoccus sp. YJ47]QQN73229.1 hypothetical protein JD971_10195 [Croceicoccus sp. YJ47]
MMLPEPPVSTYGGASLFLTACINEGAARVQPIVAGAYQYCPTHDDRNANGRTCTVDTPRSDVFLRRRENEARPGAVNLNCMRFIGGEGQLA